MSLPVDPERLRKQFPGLKDEEVAAYESVTRRLLADPRSRGQVLADVMSKAQRATEKEATGAELDPEERLALTYVNALRRMQPPARG